MSTRILIAGAPTGCWTNAGDEAVLRAMAGHLREALPEVELSVVSSSPPGTLQPLGIGEVLYTDIPSLIEAARASDLMVLGGGSVFFDYWGFDASTLLTSRHEGLAFYGGFGLLARLTGTPLMIYGVGVGPLYSEPARVFTRWVFEQAAVATVRDAASLDTLRELGVDTGRVRLTADPAFGWSAESAGLPPELESAAHPWIGVALREWESPGAPWEAAVASVLDRVLADHGGTAVFVPLHRTVDWPLTDDRGAAERVRSAMRAGRTLVLPADASADAKAAALQSCDVVLAMRLHAAVFAATAGVPAVGLAYDPKVSGAFAALEASEWCVPLAGAASAGELLARALERREEVAAHLRRTAAGLAASARENAALAAALAREGRPRREGAFIEETALRLAGRLYDAERQAAPAGAPAPERDATVARLQEELAYLRGGRGYRALQRLWRLRARIVAPGSRLERALGLSNAPPPAVPAPQQAAAAPQPPVQTPSLAGSIAQAATAAADLSPAPSARRNAAPRVALLTNRLLDWSTREPRFGGAERYVLGLGRLLRRLGFDVTFYQASTGERFEGDYYGFPVIALPRGGHLAEFEHGVGEAFHEATRAHEHVIYAMPNYGSGPMREDAVLICHGIWFDHDLLPPPYTYRTPEWFEHLHRIFSRPRKVVSVDTNSINVVRSLWPDVAGRFTYIPNAVDTRAFRPPASRAAGPGTVLFPRRMDVIRGSRILGAILEGIPHRWRMRWVGDGDGEEPEIVRAVALRDPRFEVVSASFDEMPALYQEAEICVIPSVASEGTSLACLEGLASGCAVVATNVGGLPDLVQPGVNGRLVDPEPGAIAEAITALIDDVQERRRLQKAGRETALAFRIELWEERWTALLERLGWLSGVPALAPAGAAR